MREIKFRAWDRKQMNELLFRQAIFHPVAGGFLKWHYWGLIDRAFVGVDTGWVSPTKAVENSQRFTGLTDKKKIRIYEGDILAYNGVDFYKNTYQVRYEMRFGEYDNGEGYDDNISGCGWWLKRYLLVRSNGEIDEEVGIYDYRGLHGLDNMEVIGNIYEHSYLLDKKAEK